MLANVINISGGKDSTATALLAIERETPARRFVFADTGHEHAKTYEYIDYLENALQVKIDRVQGDFSERIAHKREVVKEKWKKDGIESWVIERALSVLQPTGIPFLDLCLWKGRFPSTRARFCSEELKHYPLDNFTARLLEDYSEVRSWQGVRRDESRTRAHLVEEEDHPTKQGLIWYRPILDWTAKDCFKMLKRHNIKPNPLYTEGMGRVGCMPCIHARKDELLEISKRYPEEIERVKEWESLVSMASKRGSSTFFPRGKIDEFIEWSKTSRGGRQYDIIKTIDEGNQCKSLYGLCE